LGSVVPTLEQTFNLAYLW